MLLSTLVLACGLAPLDPGYCDCFGRSVVAPGDLDGDGVPDLLVSAPWQSRGSESQLGAVFAFSGKDGAELYRVWGCGTGDTFGGTGRLAAVGDVDGDAVGDFLVTRAAGVSLHSGKTGAPLRSHEVRRSSLQIDLRVTGLGDLDRDGAPDYAIGDGGWESERGRILWFSGKSGEQLRELHGDEVGDWFGFALEGGMDADGDAVPDLVVGIPRGNVAEVATSPRTGRAHVYSGSDGGLLVSVEARAASDCFGETVCFLGDLNGDGSAELAVGAPGHQPDWEHWKRFGGTWGYVRVHSGKDGELLRTVQGPRELSCDEASSERESPPSHDNSQFGYSLGSAGDVDADGVPDLAVGARRENGLGGSARVYSGRTGEALHELVGLPFRDWGHLVGALGDLDGDGHDDFFQVALNDTAGALSIGAVVLHSGRTGERIRVLTSPLLPEDVERDF